MIQDSINPWSNWWTKPERWVTIGFLLAIVFAPWGPAPRYAGWAIALIALLVMRLKGRSWGPVLEQKVAWILWLILFFGALTTALMKPQLDLWLKGFSQPVEFAFAIWLAAWVFLNEKNGVLIWLRVWYISTVIFISWGMLQFFGNPGGPVLFSNVNNLGLYICLILPLMLGVAFRQTELPLVNRIAWSVLAGVALFLLFLSFSINPWVTGALQLLLFGLFVPLARRVMLWLGAGLALTLVALVLINGTTLSSSSFAGKQFAGEINQLRSLMALEKSGSSQARYDIIVLAAHLGVQRPILGWGWGKYTEEARKLADHPKFKDLHPDAFEGNAHSMYFNLWVKGGLLALLAVLAVHSLAIARLVKKYRLEQEREIVVPAIILLASFFVYSIGDDVFAFRYKAAILFWTVLGYACMREKQGEARA